MNRPLWTSLGVLLALSCGTHAWAATFLVRHHEIQFDNTGRDNTVTSTDLRLDSSQDVTDSGERSIDYNADMESLEILEAYTLKPDGRHLNLQSTDIHEQLQTAARDVPAFSNMKTRVLGFPGLEVGDRIVYRFRGRTLQPVFTGQQAWQIAYQPSLGFDKAGGRITAPSSLPLQVAGRDVVVNRRQDARGNTIWEWQFKQDKQAYRFNPTDTVDHADFQKRVTVSTFRDWGPLAEAYRARTADKAEVTPAIRALAEQIVRSDSGRRQEAVRLYQWVSQNIRYV